MTDQLTQTEPRLFGAYWIPLYRFMSLYGRWFSVRDLVTSHVK